MENDVQTVPLEKEKKGMGELSIHEVSVDHPRCTSLAGLLSSPSTHPPTAAPARLRQAGTAQQLGGCAEHG